MSEYALGVCYEGTPVTVMRKTEKNNGKPTMILEGTLLMQSTTQPGAVAPYTSSMLYAFGVAGRCNDKGDIQITLAGLRVVARCEDSVTVGTDVLGKRAIINLSTGLLNFITAGTAVPSGYVEACFTVDNFKSKVFTASYKNGLGEYEEGTAPAVLVNIL